MAEPCPLTEKLRRCSRWVASEEEKNTSPTGGKNAWKGYVGFVDNAMVKASLFPAGPDGMCLMCGPPVMLEKACYPALHSMGYTDADIFCF